MFNIGMPEIIVILIVALLVIGPKRLPELANALGKGMAEFKRAMSSVKEELKIDEVRDDINEMKDSLLLRNSYEDEDKSKSDSEGAGKTQSALPENGLEGVNDTRPQKKKSRKPAGN